MFIILAFRFPLPAFATSFFFDPVNYPVRLHIYVSPFHAFAASQLLVISADTPTLAFFAPIRQTISPAAILAELSLILPLFAFGALFHTLLLPNCSGLSALLAAHLVVTLTAR